MDRAASRDRETLFTELLGALSTRFARITPTQVDSEISGWLERICYSLAIDRSVLAEYLPEKGGFYATYRWNRTGFPEVPRPTAPASDSLPWVCSAGTSGTIVNVPSIVALPKEASRDRTYMLDVGMKAIVAVPLIIGSRLVAGITLEDFTAERQWTPSLVAKLTLVGEIFANAMERKNSAVETAELRDEAHRVGRLALMGEMAAAMAHELSHPLGAILANAQAARRLLESRHPKLSELKEAVDDVIAGERRAASYVNEVRALFRRSDLHKEVLPVHLILNDVMSLTLEDLHQRGVTLNMKIEPGLPPVTADRVGVEQVMVNLIHNAADASLEKDSSKPLITIRAFPKSDRWVGISVSDTGNGIDAKNLERIFQPLFTTKSRGTGMGLPIVRSIVESHGSKMEVRSESNAGATFEFALPVAETVEAESEKD